MKTITKQTSFTLIEILVVIVIIGILAGVIMISTSGHIAQTQNTIRKQDLGSISRALRSYQSANGSYPALSCKIGDTGCLDVLNIPMLPQDPSSGSYGYSSTGSEFMLLAKGSKGPIVYKDSNGFDGSIIAMSSYYGFQNPITNVVANVNDISNGAFWGHVANFTNGWRGTIYIGTNYGFKTGTYDFYMRVRTDGIGTHPTSFSSVGIWNSTDYLAHKYFTISGLANSYKVIYVGRFTIPDNKVYYTWFSSAGVTTNYYIDYVEFRKVD